MDFMFVTQKNIFSENALAELKRYIKNRKLSLTNKILEEDYAVNTKERTSSDIVHNPKMGKIYFDLQDLPEIIVSELTTIAKQHNPNATFHTGTYTEYKGLYGRPHLPMHKDRFDHFLLIDYQYDSNTDWELLAEDQSISLKNNDALIIYPGTVTHGRPEKIFSDNDYVSMIFFDFWRNDNGRA